MSGPTPGPYEVYHPFASRHYSDARITSSVDGHDIATLIPNGKNAERFEANLTLLAASWDLRNTLRDLIEQLDSIGIPDWHGAEGLDLTKARSLIARVGV